MKEIGPVTHHKWFEQWKEQACSRVKGTRLLIMIAGMTLLVGCSAADLYTVTVENQCDVALRVGVTEDTPEDQDDYWASLTVYRYGIDLPSGENRVFQVLRPSPGFLVAAESQDGWVWWEWVSDSSDKHSFVLSDATGTCPDKDA